MQPSDGPKTILLVDDSRTVTCVLRTYLMGNGWNFIHESDGEQGLRRALREHPDLVVSDIEMPNRSGLELCECLKAAPGLRHTKVVLISSRWTTERRLSAKQAGADGWLNKPVTEEALLRLVKRLL